MSKKSLQEVRDTLAYAQLTKKQRAWVDDFILNGNDKMRATLAAYNCKDERSAQVLTRNIIASRRILACLSIYYNEDPEGEFSNLILSAIRRGNLSQAEVSAFRLAAHIKGFILPRVVRYRNDEIEEPKKEPRVVDLGVKKSTLDEFDDEE